MRQILIASLLALSSAIGGCSGSGSGPSEEVQAAKLMHGLEDKLILGQANMVLTNSSPATFTFSAPNMPDKTMTFTVTKLGKCKYQSYVEVAAGNGPSAKITTDLTGLVTEGYPPSQPQAGNLRQLKGATVTCEAINGPGSDLCSQMKQPETVFAIRDISGSDLTALATKFRQDFCQ